MKKILSFLLILVMTFSLTVIAGCGENSNTEEPDETATATATATPKTDAELIIGKWEYDYDCGKIMAETMAASEDIGSYVPENMSLIIKLNYTFNNDGTFETGIEEDAKTKVKDFLIDLYTQIFDEYFADMATQYSMTLEDLLALMTADLEEDIQIETVEDYVKFMFEDADYEEMFPDEMNNSKGKYSIADGKLYTSDSLDEEIDETEYTTYTITEDTLVLTGDSEAENTEDYPLTLKKAA